MSSRYRTELPDRMGRVVTTGSGVSGGEELPGNANRLALRGQVLRIVSLRVQVYSVTS